MSGIIYSTLMKADYLNMRSEVFPTLVRAACAHNNVPYTPEVLQFCATRPSIINALEVVDVENLDASLQAFARDQEAAVIMDKLIIDAVLVFHQSILGESDGNN